MYYHKYVITDKICLCLITHDTLLLHPTLTADNAEIFSLWKPKAIYLGYHFALTYSTERTHSKDIKNQTMRLVVNWGKSRRRHT